MLVRAVSFFIAVARRTSGGSVGPHVLLARPAHNFPTPPFPIKEHP